MRAAYKNCQECTGHKAPYILDILERMIMAYLKFIILPEAVGVAECTGAELQVVLNWAQYRYNQMLSTIRKHSVLIIFRY